MIRIITLLSLGLLVSCGGGGSDQGTEERSVTQKDLFSLWTGQNEDSFPAVDLRGYTFSDPAPISIFITTGAQCDCTLTAVGEQDKGVFVINSCSYLEGSASNYYPCDALNTTGTYTNDGTTFIVEPDGESAQVYR